MLASLTLLTPDCAPMLLTIGRTVSSGAEQPIAHFHGSVGQTRSDRGDGRAGRPAGDRSVARGAVLAVGTSLGGVAADDLVEHAVLIVEQRELALLELLEELVPGDLDQAVVLG